MTRVLVTRPVGRETELLEILARSGVEGVCVPTVAIGEGDRQEMERALSDLDEVDWLVVTSVNGAHAVAETVGNGRLPPGVRLAAVGPATSDALAAAGLPVHAMPQEYLTIAIADALGAVQGKRVVLARADAATPQLREALQQRGATVNEVVAYRTLEAPPASRELLRQALDEHLDAVLFTSGSTVRGLLALAPPHLRQHVTRLPAICIGPVTAEVARRSGWHVAAIASDHTTAGLARAVIEYIEKETA